MFDQMAIQKLNSGKPSSRGLIMIQEFYALSVVQDQEELVLI